MPCLLYMLYRFFVVIGCVLLLSSCSTTRVTPPEEPPIPDSLLQRITLERGYATLSGDAKELENKITALTAYRFSGEQLVEVHKNLSLSGDLASLAFQPDKAQPTFLYMVANATGLEQVTPGSIQRSDFLRLQVGVQDQLIPESLVLSGGTEITGAQSKHTIKLNRGMARFGITVKNPQIFVRKCTLRHTQREQLLFPASMVPSTESGQPSVTYADFEHTFAPPRTGTIPVVGYLNEQQHNDQLGVLVAYQYKESQGEVWVALPATIERNLAYQVELDTDDLLVLPDHIVGSVRVVEWGVGDDDVATPEINSSVKIIASESTLPAQTELDATRRVVHFSFAGGRAVLAFDGAYNKRVEVTATDDRISFSAINTPYRGAKLEINATQVAQGAAYSAQVKVYKDYLVDDPGVEVVVHVDANQMPTVSMGGLTWMSYNGVGRDLALYPPLAFKETVRDVYTKSWGKYAGVTMWGPRAKPVPFLSPWQYVRSTLPAGATLDWTAKVWLPATGTIPCPEGWRLPSYAEMGRIWPPDGLNVNGSYTLNNVKYTSSIVTTGAGTILADDKTTLITPRLFVISDGKNELIFPMSGWRRRDDYAGRQQLVAADVGTAFYLWTQDKGNQNWNAKVVGVLSEGSSYRREGDTHQAMTEAYQTIRCVKNE